MSICRHMFRVGGRGRRRLAPSIWRSLVVALCAAASYATVPAVHAYAAPVGPVTPAAHASPHVLKPKPPKGAVKALSGLLINSGGPVQNAPAVYVVFWGWTADPSGEQAYLTNFLSGIGGSSWLATVAEYNGGWSGQLLRGTWSDSSPIPASPTDADIQYEALVAANHFGAGTSVNVDIVVATPTGSTAGFGSSYCAYHGEVSAAPNLTYTNLPYSTDAGTGCGAYSVNGGAHGVSIVEGHELAEVITDPLPFSSPAWRDTYGSEIGDICAWTGLANVNLSTGTFASQPLWSNAANVCVMSSNAPPPPPPPPVYDAAFQANTTALWTADRPAWRTWV